jgi:hypothetical protein
LYLFYRISGEVCDGGVVHAFGAHPLDYVPAAPFFTQAHTLLAAFLAAFSTTYPTALFFAQAYAFGATLGTPFGTPFDAAGFVGGV